MCTEKVVCRKCEESQKSCKKNQSHSISTIQELTVGLLKGEVMEHPDGEPLDKLPELGSDTTSVFSVPNLISRLHNYTNQTTQLKRPSIGYLRILANPIRRPKNPTKHAFSAMKSCTKNTFRAT